jgi:4-amino-4-deoxy-L-arabinose transferase-like glycosyltransferase
MLVIIACLIIAARFPITNDEAYYIAFARDPQLSYVDAPPFVAYLNVIQAQLGLDQPIFLRLPVIILHLISVLLLMTIVKNNCKPESDLSSRLLITFLLGYIIPIFGLYSIFILPDTGLILGLSIMLLATDRIMLSAKVSYEKDTNNKNDSLSGNSETCSGKIGIVNLLLLGIGLGIGALSKYHILPLGGGILLGLLFALSRPKFKFSNLVSLIISMLIGLMIALPVFMWNYNNHYASFMFQFQHGFNSDKWQIISLIGFLGGAMLYITPWFAYVLLKNGLFTNKKFYILIPFISLLAILLISSLRKNILPHWISPAFWLLIPYSVIACKNLQPLKTMCKYTSIIWAILLFILLLPQGMTNIKYLTKQFNPDATGLADLLLWQELPQFVADNSQLQQSLTILHNQKLDKCIAKQRLIATNKWYWTAQLEYHHVFPKEIKVLNLDPNSASFYLWRDDLSQYANCPILFVGNSAGSDSQKLNQIINIKNSYTIYGIDDYKSINLLIINGILKDSAILSAFQNNLISNPKY